jgi:hypothetical protein
MSLYVLDALIWILGIRGHIPRGGDFGPVPGQSPLSAGSGTLMRAIAVFAVVVTCLSLLLWMAVWLVIKLL